MRLTGKQFAQLQMVILAAFTRDELRRLLKVEMDTSLELITGDKGFEAQVFDLLLWLERQGRMLEFVECARAANPANQALATVCNAVRAWDTQDQRAENSNSAGDLAALLGIEWVTIPSGLVRMGSAARHDTWAQETEMPQHELVLPQYLIARCAITNYQYQVFVLASEHAPPPHWQDGAFPPASTTIRSSTCPGMTPWPSAAGPMFACPAKHNGNARHVGPTAAYGRGATSGLRRSAVIMH